ncbi:MAG: hypothetical protein AAF497_20355, partial [Planctomycetota bacterium]
MADPEIRPQSDSAGPHGAHYQAADDIELPPLDDGSDEGSRNENEAKTANKGMPSLLGSVVLLAAVCVGGWFLWGGRSESDHPNWQHVAAASDASEDNQNVVVQLSSSGDTQIAKTIKTSSMDADRGTTRKVRAALRSDVTEAQNILEAAQGPGVTLAALASNPELVTALKNGRQEFFEVYVFDCCDEDGDVVEILLNGKLFATVPITHDGTSVTLPLEKGSNDVAMRGIRDGGGGVTVSLRSSRGDYYCRSMRVGQEYHMEVVS